MDSSSSIVIKKRNIAGDGPEEYIVHDIIKCRKFSSTVSGPPEMQQEMEEFLTSFESLGTNYIFFVPLNYESWETEDKLVIWFDMPGLDLRHVFIKVKGDTMMIKAEGIESPSDEDEEIRRYGGMIDLHLNEYELHAFTKEMNKGVLKVEIPKVKREEST